MHALTEFQHCSSTALCEPYFFSHELCHIISLFCQKLTHIYKKAHMDSFGFERLVAGRSVFFPSRNRLGGVDDKSSIMLRWAIFWADLSESAYHS